MSVLEERLAARIPVLRDEVRELLAEHGDHELSTVTIAKAFGGLRGVIGLICDTSSVDPDEGLSIRGIPIGELRHITAEECFHLLLTGEADDAGATDSLRQELQARSEPPAYVWDVVDALPEGTHPMTYLSAAVLAMQGESRFAKAYDEGMAKDEWWRPTLEDALDLIARMPSIAAGIYRKIYGKGSRISPDADLDAGANFARMLGCEDPTGDFARMIRLFLVLHSDHEGGNVSAHTGTLVASALSDLYRSVSAALNGLAGPLHGLANQECLHFVLSVRDEFGGVPDTQALRDFCWKRLDSGRVIPGYGHAVLRCPDPRFVALFEFGKKHCADSDVFRIVESLYDVVPKVLEEQGKAKNPWPNVDACSGSLLHHFGLSEIEFYTVLFGVSRTMGLAAQQVLARALGLPIERPKSIATSRLRELVAT